MARPSLLVLALLPGLVACGPPAWRDAQALGTANAYEQFALNNPRYPQADTAMNRAETLRWQRAQEKDTAAAWSAYLRMHDGSRRADEARKNLDDRAYDEAVVDKDPLALERYMTMFPKGAHVEEARGHLDAVRWHEAKSEDSHISYRRYTITEPKGKHVEEARKRYQQRVWERAVKNDSLRAYEGYLDEFPDGEHAADAQAALDALRFSEVELAVVLGASWQENRGLALSTLKSEASALTEPLTRNGFKVGRVHTVDLGPDASFDASAVSVPAGKGLIAVVLADAKGEAYEPRGHETVFEGTVQVHVPGRVGALESWRVTGVTTGSVYAETEFGLYKDAVQQVMYDAAGQVGRARPYHHDPK